MTSIFEQIWAKKVTFFATFFVVFTLMYTVLFVLDFLPEPPSESVDEVVSGLSAVAETPIATATVDAVTEPVDQLVPGIDRYDTGEQSGSDVAMVPTTIYIPKLNKTITVLNPESKSVADLDQALLSGAVRHPDSALLNQKGNVFILGHSSYLPNVINKNFQAFNGIQNLEWGDTIEVNSGDETFVYRVDKVYRAKASGLTVPIAGEKYKLTLATCNSFGTVDDRYIVEAFQIESL